MKVEIQIEIDGSMVAAHDRDQSDDGTIYDHYRLADGRLCLFRGGVLWKWLHENGDEYEDEG